MNTEETLKIADRMRKKAEKLLARGEKVRAQVYIDAANKLEGMIRMLARGNH